jgi:hypothetical protein
MMLQIELWDIGSGKCVQKLPQECLGPSTGNYKNLSFCYNFIRIASVLRKRAYFSDRWVNS